MNAGAKPPVVASRTPHSLLPYLWIPAVTLAVGFGGGLVLSALMAPRPDAAAAAAPRGEIPSQSVQPLPANASSGGEAAESGWGCFESLRERAGPGSPFFHFAERLLEQRTWKGVERPIWFCCTNPAYGPLKVHIDLSVVGEAKMLLSGVIEAGDGGVSAVKLLVDAWAGSDPRLAQQSLERQVVGVGRALEMTDEELARLAKTVSLLPIPRLVPEEIGEEFLPQVPPRVAAAFQATVQSIAAAGEPLNPAVGFPLSDRWLADVLLYPVETPPGKQWEYRKFGERCYSIVLHKPIWKDFTEGADQNPWPRLTLEEVDALVARQGGGDRST